MTSYDVDLLAVTKAAVTEDIPGDWCRVSQVYCLVPYFGAYQSLIKHRLAGGCY